MSPNIADKINAWFVSVLLTCSGGSGIAHGWNWTGPRGGIGHSTSFGSCLMVGTRRSASDAPSAASGTTKSPEAVQCHLALSMHHADLPESNMVQAPN